MLILHSGCSGERRQQTAISCRMQHSVSPSAAIRLVTQHLWLVFYLVKRTAPRTHWISHLSGDFEIIQRTSTEMENEAVTKLITLLPWYQRYLNWYLCWLRVEHNTVTSTTDYNRHLQPSYSPGTGPPFRGSAILGSFPSTRPWFILVSDA